MAKGEREANAAHLANSLSAPDWARKRLIELAKTSDELEDTIAAMRGAAVQGEAFMAKDDIDPQSLSFGWSPYSRNRMVLLLDETLRAVRDLNHQKGGEYAGDDDALANFRRNAQALGLSPEAIWGVYAAKHWDSIMQYIKDLASGRTRPRMESLAGRADDLITYLILFKALLQAREESFK